jgi:serine/threonine protein kinase
VPHDQSTLSARPVKSTLADHVDMVVAMPPAHGRGVRPARIWADDLGRQAWRPVLVAGDRIGAYEIVRYLGGGGMGEVYLACHIHIGRQAAIKVLLPELSTNVDVVSRFFNEARATALLRHPSIVEILDCDVHPSGRAYIVMEFMQGESLGECLGRIGSFGDRPDTALAITGQIARALVAAHAKGIVHRDLKPDNVFLASTPEGEAPVRVKILDFGIAKLMGDGAPTTRMTSTGTLVGTPLYMSPEQCRGSGRIDHRTDIYSLGCVLFELMSGRPPFIREGAGDLIIVHVSEDPPPLSSLVPSSPAPLGDLVRRMLEKDPDRRPQSMSEVVAQIEGLLDVPAARFTAVVDTPAGFPVHAGAHDSPPAADGRNNTSPAPPSISPRVGDTKVLPDQSPMRLDRSTTFPDHAPTGARPAPPDAAQSGQRGSKARGGLLAALIVAALIGGGAYLAVRAGGGNRLGRATGSAGEGAQASSAVDRGALRAAAERLLQSGAEPPWPASCRTTDPDLLRALAAAVGTLPGAPGPAQARGLAMLGALPESGAQRRRGVCPPRL